jgi:hypothetical protein
MAAHDLPYFARDFCVSADRRLFPPHALDGELAGLRIVLY